MSVWFLFILFNPLDLQREKLAWAPKSGRMLGNFTRYNQWLASQAVDQSDLIALLIYLTLLGIPLVLAIAMWLKKKRAAAVKILIVGWCFVASLVGLLIWQGHTIRERRRELEQQHDTERAPAAGLANHRVQLTGTPRE